MILFISSETLRMLDLERMIQTLVDGCSLRPDFFFGEPTGAIIDTNSPLTNDFFF